MKHKADLKTNFEYQVDNVISPIFGRDLENHKIINKKDSENSKQKSCNDNKVKQQIVSDNQNLNQENVWWDWTETEIGSKSNNKVEFNQEIYQSQNKKTLEDKSITEDFSESIKMNQPTNSYEENLNSVTEWNENNNNE